MKTILVFLVLILGGCSIHPIISFPLGHHKGITYGYDEASCRNIQLYCTADNNRGDPDLYREYTEWKDESGNTMCSCK